MLIPDESLVCRDDIRYITCEKKTRLKRKFTNLLRQDSTTSLIHQKISIFWIFSGKFSVTSKILKNILNQQREKP